MRPLLLMIRAAPQSRRFLEQLPREVARRFESCIAPVLEMVPLPARLDLAPPVALVLTSENAIAAVPDEVSLSGLRAFCVGLRTAEAATARGLVARDCGGTARQLVARIVAEAPTERLLWLRGVHAAADVTGSLRALGFDVSDAVIYDQRERPLDPQVVSEIAGGRLVVIPLFSARSARIFLEAVHGHDLGRVVALCISGAVADRLSGAGFGRVLSAQRPDARGIVALLRAIDPDALLP